MLKYDLVLIFSAIQRNCIFLEIIQKLSNEISILVYPLPATQSQALRLPQSSKIFLDLCSKLGATVASDINVSCKLMIIAQRDFHLHEIQKLKKKISAQRISWLSGLAMGNALYENLHGLEIANILVPDLKLYRHRLANFSDNGVKFSAKKIFEIGAPKYSVFDECFKEKKIDYIVAHPTPFSFSSEYEVYTYYKRLHGLVSELQKQNHSVVIKNHNADERQNYLINKKFRLLVACLFFLNADEKFSSLTGRLAAKRKYKNSKFMKFCLALTINLLDHKLLRSCTPLSDITRYSGLNLELFLPYVRKGLITGRSNSIWHGLYHELHVINLIEADMKYRHEDKMHKVAMKYFGVHYSNCLEFNAAQFKVISRNTRKASITPVLRKILKSENLA